METQGISHANCVIAFAGHMIDRHDRPSPRFPASAEESVRHSIRAVIEQLQPAAAISSAACGGDIIFAEEVLQAGIPLHIILPFEDRADFIKHSVGYAGLDWIERFERVCECAAEAPYFVKSGPYTNDRDFEDNQRAVLFFGLGIAAASNLQLICLILCDEQQLGHQIGGTRSFLNLCGDVSVPYNIIDVAALRDVVHS